MSGAERPARRAWLWRGLAIGAAGGLAALAADIVWRCERWDARLADVRFVDHPEKIAGAGAAVSVTGYLVATVDSSVDFFELARAEGARPKVHAALCDSGRELSAWTDPLPRDGPVAGGRPFGYTVLVPLRSASVSSPGESVDLSAGGEDVCLRFMALTMAPLSWVPSSPVVVPLPDGLRERLRAYSRHDGEVRLVLDPACAPQLCEPGYSAARALSP